MDLIIGIITSAVVLCYSYRTGSSHRSTKRKIKNRLLVLEHQIELVRQQTLLKSSTAEEASHDRNNSNHGIVYPEYQSTKGSVSDEVISR